MPEVGEPDSFSEDEPSHKEYSSNTENVSSESEMFHGGMGSNKSWASFVDLFTLSGSIAEWNTSNVNVRVGISSNKIEEACAAAASIIADCSEFRTASLRVTNEKFDQKSRKFKESIEERSTNDATPMFAKESLIRIITSSFLGSHPVPISSSSGNTEVD